jgi:hypothetical protein
MNEIDFKEQLEIKIMKLSQNIWENRVNGKNLSEWLTNFKQNDDIKLCEQTNALYLLSNFMYFGTREIRVLLKSLYRDKFFKPLIQKVRKDCNSTTLFSDIKIKITAELQATKFLGIGNPSESGTHLLYFFRQENELGKEDFMHSHEIISINRNPDTKVIDVSLKKPEIKRYIFLDDVCGSGTQAIEYSDQMLEEMKAIDPNIKVCYFALFSTKKGMENIRKETVFDEVDCIFELDDSFKCFSDTARQYRNEDTLDVSKAFAKSFSSQYGLGLGYKHKDHMLGYKNSQLLLGFAHNTPDNTIPIIWGEENGWVPIFKRYHKNYGTKY